MTRWISIRALAAIGLAVALSGRAWAGDVSKLPENQWTRLTTKPQPGPLLCAPVWAPPRGQLLHWGATRGGNDAGPNDVRAFDAAALDWVSDYESDPPRQAGVRGTAGQGSLLPSGRPVPSMTLNGVCWDSKRGQAVYTMYGFMAAYDPKARTWKDLKPRTVVPHRIPIFPGGGERSSGILATELDGAPTVYGMGTCYDPENDEILLFPHFNARNASLREATGQITGHQGTFRYSFKDNTWRVVSDTFGSPEMQAARQGLVGAMARASAAMDAAWTLNRQPDAAKAAEAAKGFVTAAGELEKLALPTEAKAGLAPVAGPALSKVEGLLKSAAAALSGGKPGEAMKPARDALWAMNEALDGALRVEPPPRCAAPMVYDPKNKCIVMFGGHTSLMRTDLGWPKDGEAGPDVFAGQNDTWLYDVATRQWREIAVKNRPPLGRFACRVPMLAHDPASGLIVLVTRAGDPWGTKIPRKSQVWTLDVARGEWSKRLETDWPGELPRMSGQGSEMPKSTAPTAMFGYDPVRKLALIVQPEKEGMATYAMRLDLNSLPSEPAPAWTPPPPIRPQEVPPDDPEWVARLKALPANTWVAAKPPHEPRRRDWGTLGIDPVRGWVVYQGGGHSTWQVNNVSVYNVGANRWSEQVGDHNAYVPPNEWEGSTIGYRGGVRARHERRSYSAYDGRVYSYTATEDIFQDGQMFLDPDYARFYDIDRGGVWRELRVAHIDRPEGAPRSSNQQNAVDASGRIVSLLNREGWLTVYNAAENRFVARKLPQPLPPMWGGESQALCLVPDRDELFCAAWRRDDGKATPSAWTYSMKDNTFTTLTPRRPMPAGVVPVVAYATTQKCVLMIVGGREWKQWVYSFDRNDWAELEVRTEGGRMGVNTPYGQLVWVEKHGVFVNVCGGTWVMRPDFGQVKWK